MAEAALPQKRSTLECIGRWVGGIALAASILFIAQRLWLLDWASLRPYFSSSLAGSFVGAGLLFAAADVALARAWAVTADSEGAVAPRDMRRIYARGVLMKYLPGAIFQYLSRQYHGAKTGLGHKRLAQSALLEIALHLVSSLAVAAVFFLAVHSIAAALAAGALVAICLLSIRRPLTRALILQMSAFALFALAAILVGFAVFPAGTGLAKFAAIFLLAWLAGFIVPVAPGGVGVREAALLMLVGGALPTAGLMAATLALRIASIGGDVLFGLAFTASGRSPGR